MHHAVRVPVWLCFERLLRGLLLPGAELGDLALVLRGGTVVDGTGGTPFVADVAVAGDRIVAIVVPLNVVFGVVVMFVVLGAWLLRTRVHPLAEQVVESRLQ